VSAKRPRRAVQKLVGKGRKLVRRGVATARLLSPAKLYRSQQHARSRRQGEAALAAFMAGAERRFTGPVLVDAMWDNPNYWIRYALFRAAVGSAGGREVGVVGTHREAEGRRTLEEALSIARELEDKRVLSDLVRNLGLCELASGQIERARALCHEALDLAQEAKLRDFEGRALLALGEVYASTVFDDSGRGDKHATAEDYFARGIQIYREIGNEAELARGLERLGKYRIEHGDVGAGKKMLEEAALIFGRLGMKAGDRVKKVVEELG